MRAYTCRCLHIYVDAQVRSDNNWLNTMKILTRIALVLIGSVLGLLAFCEHQENPTSYFSDYSKAKASGIMDRGWIPTYIPKSSTDIRETHNIDTNIVKMTFKYLVGDTKDIEKNCTAKKISENILQYECVYFESDVFIELRSDGSGRLESHPRRKKI